MNLLLKLKAILPVSETKGIYYLFLGVIVSSVVEAFGIGIILPFISIVNDPKIINEYPNAIYFFEQIGLRGTKNIVITLSALILFAMCAKNLYLFYFMKFQHSFIHHSTAKLSVKLLEKYLQADYLYHIKTNTSELLRNIKTTVPLIFSSVLGPMITLTSEALLMFIVLSLLMIVEPVATLIVIVLFGFVASIYYKSIKKKSRYYGELRIRHEGETFKWINQSLGGIREVRLLGREAFFTNQCGFHYNQLADIAVYEHLISQAPRLFLEALMVATLMLIIIVLMLQGSSNAHILPILVLFGAAAFRLMPAANRILSSVITLKFTVPAIDLIYNNMAELESKYNKLHPNSGTNGNIELHDAIYLKNITFSYPETKDNALENISLRIPKNKSVGVMGPSGSGKTTLLNIILGLLKPTKGHIFIDQVDMYDNLRGWQMMIGFVPQDIYLTDDSIKRNVAYGLDDKDIDESLVWKALEMAQLDAFIKSLPDGLHTFVGERGVKVSGGQRQRIGIARALYHNPKVLIFDEATSALDLDTEKEVRQSIESLANKKTIIIVAHRLSTIEKCDIVYKLEKGIIYEASFQNTATCVPAE